MCLVFLTILPLVLTINFLDSTRIVTRAKHFLVSFRPIIFLGTYQQHNLVRIRLLVVVYFIVVVIYLLSVYLLIVYLPTFCIGTL